MINNTVITNGILITALQGGPKYKTFSSEDNNKKPKRLDNKYKLSVNEYMSRNINIIPMTLE